MKFRTTLELGGKTATGIQVPDEVVAALGSGKRPAVRVSLGDYTYRGTIASMGGRYMLPVAAEHREAAGIKAGDEVEVSLALDTEPRVVTVPADFARALAESPSASLAFEQLSYSERRRIVLGIEGTSNPETRRRRIEKATVQLGG